MYLPIQYARAFAMKSSVLFYEKYYLSKNLQAISLENQFICRLKHMPNHEGVLENMLITVFRADCGIVSNFQF